jgi:PAP2 superfamily
MSQPIRTPKQTRGSRELDAAKPVLLALALMAVALAFLNGLAASLGKSPQFSFTLAGSFALFLATRPKRLEIVITFILGLALRLAYGAYFGIQPYFGSAMIGFAGFLGVASLLVLAFTALRKRRFSEFGTAAFFPFVSIMVGFILPFTNHLSPLTFDAHLLAADGAFGFQPSFVLGRVIGGHPTLWDLTSTVYYALPFAVALLCAAQLGRRPDEVRRLLWLFGIMSAVGFCLYAVCPATGPIYAFRGFPLRAPDLSGLSLAPLAVPSAPRNAIPSLHFSTALLVFWNTSQLRRSGRIAAALFLAGTAFATLALGEHYLIDIVVAFPFSLTFQAAFADTAGNAGWRYGAMGSGAALVAAWLLALRFWVQPLIEWRAAICALAIATLGFSIWARRELSRRELSRRDLASG